MAYVVFPALPGWRRGNSTLRRCVQRGLLRGLSRQCSWVAFAFLTLPRIPEILPPLVNRRDKACSVLRPGGTQFRAETPSRPRSTVEDRLKHLVYRVLFAGDLHGGAKAIPNPCR